MADKKEQPTLLEQATQSLTRIQEFDVDSLPRATELGTDLAFGGAVAPAKRIVALFKRLSATALQDFPDPSLDKIRSQADAQFTRFSEILSFSPTDENPAARRQQLIQQIAGDYDTAFQVLHPFISYSLHRSADFSRLDSEARAAVQQIRDQSKGLSDELTTQRDEGQRVLDEIRKVAAEQGVTQQARYFKEAADEHATEAEKWRDRMIKLAWWVGAFAVFSIILHKIPWIAPENTLDAVQVAISKVLIFAVLSYLLFLAARNFLSHKHNSIVNRHRQQALLTYKTLVDAAGDTPHREVILVHASACIFGPQSTGYAPDGTSDASRAQSVIELLSKPAQAAES